MRNEPLVTICIPTFNAEKTIHRTLESILSQSFTNMVIHVSDNASTDHTVKIVESIKDARVLVHRLPKNIGAEGNFNHCINLASGKYAAIYHADDIYAFDMVERQVGFLEGNTGVDAVFTEATLIDEDDQDVGSIHFPKELGHATDLSIDFPTLLKAVLRHSNFLVCPSAMVKTDILKNTIGRWRSELFKSSADLDVWLRIAQRGSVGLIRSPLIRYRISTDQYTAKVRGQITRPDFFLVTDYYLRQESVAAMLSSRDIENLDRLIMRDKVMRAINGYIASEYAIARELIENFFGWASLKSSFQTKRGLGVFIAAIFLKCMLIFRIGEPGKGLFITLKRKLNK